MSGAQEVAGGADPQAPKGVPTPKANAERGRLGRVARMRRFFAAVVAELAKVVWPTRDELVRSTVVVLIFTVVMTAGVAAADAGAAKVAEFLFGG